MEHIQTYLFDSIGNKYQRNWYRPNEERYKQQTYTFDSLGNKTSMKFYSEGKLSFSEVYLYNFEQNTRTEKHFDSMGILTRENIFITEGNNEEVIVLDRFGNQTGRAINYYDDFKRHIGWEGFDLDGSSKGNRVIEYDKYGNIILEKIIRLKSNMNVEEVFQYKFDSKNSWIQKIKFINGEPKLIRKRKIEYY